MSAVASSAQGTALTKKNSGKPTVESPISIAECLEHFNIEMFRWLREQTPAVEAQA